MLSYELPLLSLCPSKKMPLAHYISAMQCRVGAWFIFFWSACGFCSLSTWRLSSQHQIIFLGECVWENDRNGVRVVVRLRENCEPLHFNNASVSPPLYHGKSSELSRWIILGQLPIFMEKHLWVYILMFCVNFYEVHSIFLGSWRIIPTIWDIGRGGDNEEVTH